MDRYTEQEGSSPEFNRAISFSDDTLRQIFKSDSLKLIRSASAPLTTTRPFDQTIPFDMDNIYVRAASMDTFPRTDSVTGGSPEGNLTDGSSSIYSSDVQSWDTSHRSNKMLAPPNSPTLSSAPSSTPSSTPPSTPTSTSTEDSGFTWAFFNCPATIKAAGLLLLAGGLFSLTVALIAASPSIAAAGAVISGIGALLSIYGQFKKPRLTNMPMQSSDESLYSNDSSLMSP